MGKRQRNFAIGTVFAAVFGYVAGILTAPKSGKETRKDIQDTALKTKAEAERRLKELHTELNELLEVGRKKVEKAKTVTSAEISKAIKIATQAKEKAADVLSAVHEGGADDKDLQKAIKDVNSAIEHLKKYVQKEV